MEKHQIDLHPHLVDRLIHKVKQEPNIPLLPLPIRRQPLTGVLGDQPLGTRRQAQIGERDLVGVLRRRSATILAPLSAPLPAPFMLQALLWSDLAARRLRRIWVRHLRQQLVEVVSLHVAQATQPPAGPPPMRTRVQAAHRRRSWTERLAGNTFRPEQPPVRFSLFGLPAHLARYLGLSSLPAG